MKLCVRDLSASYGKREVLHEISFSVPDGAFVAVVGKNGSGKSTLVSCLCGFLPFRGEILLDDTSLSAFSGRERARKMAIMPQHLTAPHIPVEALVSLGRNPYLPLGGHFSDEDRHAVETALSEAELLSARTRHVDTLSGGERRRAYLGMILAQDTPLMILDEATANMDLSVEAYFWRLVSEMRMKRGKTVIAVMHNLGDAVRYADHIALLDGGELCFFGKTKALLETSLLEDTMGVTRYEADGEMFFRG